MIANPCAGRDAAARLGPTIPLQSSHPGTLRSAAESADTGPTPVPTEGRDARGRFAAGNRGGPGNPFARRVEALRQALLDTLTPDDLQAIVRRLVEAARQGDVAAARLVLQYGIGKPAEAVDPDTLDLGEWQHWLQMPVPAPLLQGLLGPLQVPLACTLARTVLPLLQDALARQIGQQFNPAAPVPAGGDQPQPKPPGPVAPHAGPPPVAPAVGPTPDPVPAQPAGESGQKGAAARPERGRQPQAGATRSAGCVAGLAGAGPSASPDTPEAELARWLGLLEGSLLAAPAPADNPKVPAFPWDGPPVGTG